MKIDQLITEYRDIRKSVDELFPKIIQILHSNKVNYLDFSFEGESYSITLERHDNYARDRIHGYSYHGPLPYYLLNRICQYLLSEGK